MKPQYHVHMHNHRTSPKAKTPKSKTKPFSSFSFNYQNQTNSKNFLRKLSYLFIVFIGLKSNLIHLRWWWSSGDDIKLIWGDYVYIIKSPELFRCNNASENDLLKAVKNSIAIVGMPTIFGINDRLNHN